MFIRFPLEDVGSYGFNFIKWKAYEEKEVKGGFRIYILWGLITNSGHQGQSQVDMSELGRDLSHPKGKVCLYWLLVWITVES